MTPSIATAGDSAEGTDDNSVGLTDLTGLNLLNFEFSPHYENTSSALQRHSQSTEYPIYACPNSSGISVVDSSMTICGDITCFFKVHIFKLNADRPQKHL